MEPPIIKFLKLWTDILVYVFILYMIGVIIFVICKIANIKKDAEIDKLIDLFFYEKIRNKTIETALKSHF